MQNLKNLLAVVLDLLIIPPLFYGLLWGSILYFGNYENAGPYLPLYVIKSYPITDLPDWLFYCLLGSILGGLSFVAFNPFHTPTKGKYGNARWANNKDIKKMALFADKGLILGKTTTRYIRTDEPLSILVIAPPGSGKTVGGCIPNLISCSNSMIVHDPKGELFEKTSTHRSAFSKILKFSPGEKESISWNPLSKGELPDDWDDIQVVLSRIAVTLFPDPKTGSNYWEKGARTIFMFWGLYIIFEKGETSLPEILRRSLIEGNPQLSIMEALGIEIEDGLPSPPNQALPERVILEGNSLYSMAEKQFSGLFDTFKSGLDVFLDSRVAENFSGVSAFCLNDLRKEPCTLYLCVRNSDQERLKTVLTMFFESACLAYINEEPSKNDCHVTFLIDEMRRLGKMTEMINMPAISRSYRVNAIFIWQSFNQIGDIYGDKGAAQFKECCAYHIYFSSNSETVAESVSKSIGDKTRKKISTSRNKQTFLSGNTTESYEGVRLIKSQELMSMGKDEIIILVQNHYQTPIRAKSPFWFLDNEMKSCIPKHLQGKVKEEAKKKPQKAVIIPFTQKEEKKVENQEIDQDVSKVTEKEHDVLDDLIFETKSQDNEPESLPEINETQRVEGKEDFDRKRVEDESSDSDFEELADMWGGEDLEEEPPEDIVGFCDECGSSCVDDDIGNSCNENDCQGSYISS